MTRGLKIAVKCARCKVSFMARTADRKRGWGRFCSKSCKAIRQTQQTGRGAPTHDERDDRERYGDEIHPFSSEAFEP